MSSFERSVASNASIERPLMPIAAQMKEYTSITLHHLQRLSPP